jgi:two-component system, LytTR family, response regulator
LATVETVVEELRDQVIVGAGHKQPFEFERFLVAVTKMRVAQGEKPRPAEERDASRDFVFINVQKKKVKILFSEICYIESQREYIKITTTRGEYLSKMSTHEIESILPAQLFRRVHRSYIVAVRRIDSYTAELIEINGVTIPIGKGYKDSLDNL